MSEDTKYKLQKRIKELEAQNAKLRLFQSEIFQIFDALIDTRGELNAWWVIRRMRDLLRDLS